MQRVVPPGPGPTGWEAWHRWTTPPPTVEEDSPPQVEGVRVSRSPRSPRSLEDDGGRKSKRKRSSEDDDSGDGWTLASPSPTSVRGPGSALAPSPTTSCSRCWTLRSTCSRSVAEQTLTDEVTRTRRRWCSRSTVGALRELAARNVPLGILNDQSEFGPTRLPQYDAEINRLEGPYRVWGLA